jgi:cell division protease FtsH
MSSTPTAIPRNTPPRRGRLGATANKDDLNAKSDKLSEQDLWEKRKELFETGSEFLPATRNDVVGIDNVLAEIDEVIHWLRHAAEYQKYGSRLEPGIVFEGDPGTGKTLVSRYIATESDALFVNVRDFPHNEALLTENDVAALFEWARDTYNTTEKPIVLFWDEFESNAVERSGALPEQAAAVAQLTAELDGVHGKNEGILLIGCTNYMHMIDHALLRSGRMGLQIEFHPPDREGKAALLDHYLGKTDTKGLIDIDTLSYFFDQTATAADIEEACVEAWRYAVRRTIEESFESPSLSQVDLMKVFVKRLVGPPTTFINIPLDKRRLIALHEVGHAVTALVAGVPVRLITVQPGKRALGRVMTAEIEEHIGTQEDYKKSLMVTIGSMAAEAEAGLDPTVGITSDIRQAVNLAQSLIDNLTSGTQTGLLNVGALSEARASGQMETMAPSVSERLVARSDNEVEDLLNEAQVKVTTIMRNIGKDNLWAIADEVNERTTLTGAEFAEVVAKHLGTEDFSEFLSVARTRVSLVH